MKNLLVAIVFSIFSVSLFAQAGQSCSSRAPCEPGEHHRPGDCKCVKDKR